MTERLADITARIEGIRQLGTVVNAMKGIAAARAHVARDQVDVVDSYAATIAAAMARAAAPNVAAHHDHASPDPAKGGLLIFCAEQGFAGAFSERVLDSLGQNPNTETMFLVGSRGLSIATARGLVPHWTAMLPSHTSGIPKLANEITTAIYSAVAKQQITHLDVVFTKWGTGQQILVRQGLFPLSLPDLPPAKGDEPLTQIPASTLMDSLGQDYFHSQVCKAALHAFAAENEARMEAMAAAATQITRELETFEARLRRVRQEAITAEIMELGTGSASARPAR